MTITKTDFSDTTRYVGDIVNLYDMINLNSISDSAISVTITVTPSYDIDFDGYNYGSHFFKLLTEDIDPLPYGYIRGALSDLDNIGTSSQRTGSELLLKLNFVGYYSVSFTYNDTFLEFELVTGQKTYRVSLKNQVNLSLGIFGTNSDNDTIQLYYDGDDLATYLHLYEGDNLVDNPSSIFSDIEYIKFTLSLNNKQLYTENNYTVTLSGTYKISLQAYSSGSYFITYQTLEVVVAPISYTSLTIPGLLNDVRMSYGSSLPSLYKRFRIGSSNTVFTESDFPDKYTVVLVDAVNTNTVISQADIPTAPPATYILKITFPGLDTNPLLGKLSITKANVKIHSTLAESYTLESENITLSNMFSVKTSSGFIEESAPIVLTATFTNIEGNVSNPSINPFDPTVSGVLTVTATYNGNTVYNKVSSEVYTVIGPTLLGMSISKKYVFSPSEFTTNKKTQVTNDILSNMDIINLRSTTGNQSVTQTVYDMISGHTTVVYKPDTTVIRKFSLFYALNTGSGFGTVQESIVSAESSIFATLSNNLRGSSSVSISIRGIRVYPGAFLTVTYLPDNSNNASTVTLSANNTGEVYAIDASNGVADSVTYVSLPETLDLNTSNITSASIGKANFTDLATLPNGLYTIGLTVKMTTNNSNTGVDSNAYNINITSPSHSNILIADSFSIEMDIMNHLLDGLPRTGYNIGHLLTEPYFNNDLRNVASPELSNYIMSSDYLRLSYKINNVNTQIDSAFVESFDVRPNMQYIASNTVDFVATIPFTSASSALNLYYNNTKLAATNVYSNGLPYMIISAVTSNILTWFTNNNITLQTPTGINSSNTLPQILDHIYENIDSSSPLVTNYDRIQDIVLDSGHTNTSRAFWIAMIDKLNTARSGLSALIAAHKSDYFDSDDLDGIAEYSGIDFSDDAELDAYFGANTAIYAIVLRNEIDTVILRKHLLTSMVAIKSSLVPTLSVKYAPLTMTVSGTVTNGQLVVSMPDGFVGTSGDVSISIAVSVTTSQGSLYQDNTSTLFTSYIYGKPSNATITYREKTGNNAVVTGVTGTTTNSNNQTVSYATFTDPLGTYIDSVRMVGGSSIALRLNYATSGSVNISNDSDLTITGLTRIKRTQSRTVRRTTGTVTTETENISGPAIVTITQQSVSSLVDLDT